MVCNFGFPTKVCISKLNANPETRNWVQVVYPVSNSRVRESETGKGEKNYSKTDCKLFVVKSPCIGWNHFGQMRIGPTCDFLGNVPRIVSPVLSIVV